MNSEKSKNTGNFYNLPQSRADFPDNNCAVSLENTQYISEREDTGFQEDISKRERENRTDRYISMSYIESFRVLSESTDMDYRIT